ncbi:MAG: AgmX/PglI C-terminal domain-containing protein [Deltaproteobacteria bacterium]|nr:AgmX/PglI C-terminal domain-containing protein [Deltaproteobacteria bacterium]
MRYDKSRDDNLSTREIEDVNPLTPQGASDQWHSGRDRCRPHRTGSDKNVCFQLLASGPPIDPVEVETADTTLEVVILWGEQSVLHVAHLSPPRPFSVGDRVDAKGRPATDFLIAGATLGVDCLPVVVETHGGFAVVIPSEAEGEISKGSRRTGVATLGAEGRLQPCARLAGGWQYPLASDACARIRYQGFTFLVRTVASAKRIGTTDPVRIDWNTQRWTLLCAGLMLLMLTLFYLLPPNGAALSLERLDTESRLIDFVRTPPEYIPVETDDLIFDKKNENQGKRHVGDEGAMGTPDAPKAKRRYGVPGPESNPDPHLARQRAREEANQTGIIGFLRKVSGSWDSPTSPFGRQTALGRDPMAALGDLLGDQIGSSFGFNGLGMRGTGRGGGGTGLGTTGVGILDTLGKAGYEGNGRKFSYGRPKGFGKREPKVPPTSVSRVDTRGSLAKEVIRRIINRHLNEIRFCYEQALTQRPDLQGRVAVKFIIAPTGAVQTAINASSTVGNPQLEGCIVNAVRRWNFPAPEGGGIVAVTYPFLLQIAGE